MTRLGQWPLSISLNLLQNEKIFRCRRYQGTFRCDRLIRNLLQRPQAIELRTAERASERSLFQLVSLCPVSTMMLRRVYEPLFALLVTGGGGHQQTSLLERNMKDAISERIGCCSFDGRNYPRVNERKKVVERSLLFVRRRSTSSLSLCGILANLRWVFTV